MWVGLIELRVATWLRCYLNVCLVSNPKSEPKSNRTVRCFLNLFTAALRLHSNEQLREAVNECIQISPAGDCSEGSRGPIGEWDVSAVTNMWSIFSSARTFNADLSKWDVSAVTTMEGLFAGAESFNQDVSKWDVSAVTDMRAMFSGASAFNQDLSKWDVSAVTNMADMFYLARAFSQDLSNWDVSSVTAMSFMFYGASSFNIKLCGKAWVNTKANKNAMFVSSPGSIASKVCATTKNGNGCSGLGYGDPPRVVCEGT